MSYLVGVCGGSGSGKTTLSALLQEKLHDSGVSCSLLSFDDYYKHEPGMTQEQRVLYNFDVPDALDGHLLVDDLAKLKAGQAVETPIYDMTTQSRLPQTRHIEPSQVIIVEGVLIFAIEELRNSFDLTLYVDSPADVRLLRRITRDIEERGHTVRSASAMYLNTVKEAHERYVEPYRSVADLVINNVFDEAALAILLEGIKGAVK